MAISAVGSSTDIYGQLSSGKRINSAADDAAGLAISNKLESQSNGYNAGNENAQSGINALKVSDGALSQINDNLQRIYELSIKAGNSLYTPAELKGIQDEISGLMGGIQDIAKGTEYNTLKLLDGSMADMDIASNPNGGGPSIKMANATLEALGIDGYDVTGKFDINRITDAMDKVNSSRSSMGAQTNALEHLMSSNSITSENLTSSQSKIEDLDMFQAISDMKKQQVLDNYKIMMQKQEQEQQTNRTLGLFNA